jgi:peptide/nickel transport system permease protein
VSAVLTPAPTAGSASARLVWWELGIGGALVGLLALLALLGPGISGHDARFVDLEARFLPPFSPGHLLGTDQLGRDMLARVLHGLRWSLGIALCATLVAFTVGTTLGLVAARGGGWVATGIRQVTAFAQSFPVFVLAVSLVAVLGNGFVTVVAILGLVTWPVFCRVVQAEASSLYSREYVLAAEMLQMSRARLYLRHVLPGLLPSLSVLLAFHFADMLIAESALSFLGIGAPIGAPTWGTMLQESRTYLLTAPWMLLVPATAVVLLVIAANLLGDGLRRWLA